MSVYDLCCTLGYLQTLSLLVFCWEITLLPLQTITMQSYFSEIRTNSWGQCIKHVYAAWNRPACNGAYVRLTSRSTGPGQEHWKTADSGPWPVDRSTSNADKRCWHSRRETPPNQCTTCMLNTDWNKIDLSHITHVWSHYLNQNETNVWFRYLLLVEKLQLHVSLRQTHKCHTGLLMLAVCQ